MISLKICKIIDMITFFGQLDPHSMRCSLNLQLRSAHEKPQQPNRFDSPIDPGFPERLELTSEITLQSSVFSLQL